MCIMGGELVGRRAQEVKTKGAGVDEECNVEKEVEKESDGEYSARCETHMGERERERGWLRPKTPHPEQREREA